MMVNSAVRYNHSLKQTWLMIIMIALILPSVSIMIWYGMTIYKDKVKTALIVRSHENESLARNIEFNIRTLTTTLEDKSDAFAIQLWHLDRLESLWKINLLLKTVIQHNSLIHEIFIISKNKEIIALIEPDMGILGDELLSKSQLTAITEKSGLNGAEYKPEISVPLLGKTHIGITVEDNESNDYIFSISVPITVASEVEAVLIAYIEVNKLWLKSKQHKDENDKFDAVDYILNSKNVLIAVASEFEDRKGITFKHSAVKHDNSDMENHIAYIGMNNQSVYGTETSMPFLDWSLVSEIKVSSITGSIVSALMKLYLWTLLGLLVVMRIVFMLVKKTLSPIQVVCKVINNVANGNYDYVLEDTGITELDRLNKDVEYMILEREKAEINLQNKYQLKAKEKEQREMLDSMDVSVMTIDIHGQILTSNKAAEKLFGYNSKEMLQMNINMLMPNSIAQNHDKYLKEYMETGQSQIIGVGRDLMGKTKSTQLFPMRLLIAELPLSTDGVQRFIGSCIDLTDIEKKEEQIRRSQKMDALGKLTGGVAHDFNNILGVMLGYTQLLKLSLKKYRNQKLINYVNEIKKAGDRGANLTNKLMDFTQQRVSEVMSLDINKLIHNDFEMLKKTLTIRTKLILNLSEDIWEINVDKNGLEDSILNIVINAVYAMKNIKSVAQLTIITNNHYLKQKEASNFGLQAGDYVKISFLDTGIGIDKNTIDKIFDPFYTSKGKEGTGLGLSQVYSFVKNYNGAIEVDSQIGLGTQFTLYFPRSSGEIITDSSDSVTENSDLMGYEVYCAENGKLALEILNQQPIDLLITDIIMPEMDGYQLASIVQSKYPHIKIQLVSGYSDQSNLNLIDEKLAKKLLQKPFNSHTLFIKIRQLLNEKVDTSSIVAKKYLNKEKNQVKRIKWEDSFNTGVETVDEEHKEVLSIINSFIDLQDVDGPKDTGRILLKRFLDSSVEHFVNEENLLEPTQYPYLNKHKMVHKLFIQRIIQFQKDYEIGEFDTDSLLNFLIDWKEHHIIGMDKEAFAYTAENGFPTSTKDE